MVQWNGYTDEQRARIWERLASLRRDVVEQWVHVENPQHFRDTSAVSGVGSETSGEVVYEVLRYLVTTDGGLADGGLRAKTGNDDALTLLQAIDAEVYRRSIAHYERSFRVTT